MNDLTNVVVAYTLPKITYDLKEVKEQVKLITSKYQNLIISEEDIPEMKKDIATLNKLSKAIDSKRKDVVKEIKSPLTEFENELKSLVNELNGAYRSVKDQIDTFTEQQKELRKNEIMSWEEWESYFEFDERWLGKARSDISIKTDLGHLKTIYNNNVTLIETTCKMVGLETGKYVELLQNKIDIKDIVSLIQNDKEVIESIKKEEPKIEPVFNEDLEKTQETYYITATEEQHKLLEVFMLKNNIEYQIQEGVLF